LAAIAGGDLADWCFRMSNIWTDTAAPYVLAALLGATGWIVNSAVVELKQLKLIEYTIADANKDGHPLKQVDIYNRSQSFTLLAGDFSFRCRGNMAETCFGSNNSSGTPVELAPLEGISLPSDIHADATGAMPIYKARAQLAAQSAVRYSVSVKDSKSELLVLYEPGIANVSANNVLFRLGDDSWEGWLIQNYLKWLIYTFRAIALLFFSWCLVSLFQLIAALWRPKKPEEGNAKQPEKIYVIVSENGVPDVKAP
jgi:hypothetical protein